MRQAKISELKNHLSRYLDLVRGGETVQVLDRDEPIAQLVPMPARTPAPRASDEARLAELERRGILRRGSGQLPPSILDSDPPGPSAGVLEALLDERRHGR
jgi:antitoxin (DNA-binding transcriptional repressor) of toxin-antitoxin stability system